MAYVREEQSYANSQLPVACGVRNTYELLTDFIRKGVGLPVISNSLITITQYNIIPLKVTIDKIIQNRFTLEQTELLASHIKGEAGVGWFRAPIVQQVRGETTRE